MFRAKDTSTRVNLRSPSGSLRRRACALLALVVVVGSAGPIESPAGRSAGNSAPGTAIGQGGASQAAVRRAPTELPGLAVAPLHRPANLLASGQPGSASSRSRAGAAATRPGNNASEVGAPRRLKLLLIAADGNETDYPALRAFLDQIGVPYDTLLAAETPLTSNRLWDGIGRGHYQGVVLTTGNLTYFDAAAAQWRSAFTDAEWATLWDYERRFGIRQVTSYTYPAGPPDSYGLNLVGAQDTSSAPLGATLTDAGRAVFPYLNAAAPVMFKNAWVYLATVADSTVTTPLLVTPGGHAIASITRYPDGRENLAVMAANNPFLLHSELLSYGVVNWVTGGLFLGERHVNVAAQVDDLLIDSEIWDPVANSDLTGRTYRLTGTDFSNVVSWQRRLQAGSPNLAGVRLELAFNGEGASGIYLRDTLTPAVKLNQASFGWVNHTYSHENLDFVDYTTATAELAGNHVAATTTLNLTTYARDALVQPDISGLGNPQFLRAASDFGIRYLISDTSRPGGANPSPNAGFYSPFQPNILVVPRRPTNLFYNLSTPAEFVDEYNHYYGPGGVWAYWPRNLTYAEIVDQESTILLGYLLRWDLDPWMFHQANLRSYDGSHSLLGDLLDATFAKYRSVYNLPVRNLGQHDAGVLMARRMAYDGSGVTGVLTPCVSLTLTAPRPAVVPVTGVAADSTEVYGGQSISYVQLAANAPKSVAAPAC